MLNWFNSMNLKNLYFFIILFYYNYLVFREEIVIIRYNFYYKIEKVKNEN